MLERNIEDGYRTIDILYQEGKKMTRAMQCDQELQNRWMLAEFASRHFT